MIQGARRLEAMNVNKADACIDGSGALARRAEVVQDQ